MSNKFVIYSGFTSNSKPPHSYFTIKKKNKNLFGYAKTLEEAKQQFNLANLGDAKWVQIVCLTTLKIIESQESFNIHKPIFEGYYSDENCN